MTLFLFLLACALDLPESDATEPSEQTEEVDGFAADTGDVCGASYRVLLDGVGYPDLGMALAAAPFGAVVELCTGSHEATVEVSRDVSLVGLGEGPEQVRWTASKGRMLDISAGEVLLANLTMTGGWSDDGGAVFVAEDAALAVVDVAFSENTASQGAGGAILAHGELSLHDALFERNQAAGDGGAVYADGPRVQLSGVSFEENVALGDGGALYVDGDWLAVEGGVLSRNQSSGAGGAVALDAAGEGEAWLTDVVFSQDDARTAGGALWLTGSQWTLSLVDVSLVDNAAAVAGGLAVDEDCVAIIEHVGGEVLRNQANAVSLSAESKLDSWESDWGEGEDDNRPADVAGGFSAGKDAEFSCRGSDCSQRY